MRITGEAVWELENEPISGTISAPNRAAGSGARAWSARTTAPICRITCCTQSVAYIDAIERATDRVLITTAYFIPDREVWPLDRRRPTWRARPGADPRVLQPHPGGLGWRGPQYELLREGVEIWLYQHAMVLSVDDGGRSLVDDRHGEIDRLSMRGNYEVRLRLFSPLAARIEEIFANDLTTPPDDRRVGKRSDPHPCIGEVLLGPLILV